MTPQPNLCASSIVFESRRVVFSGMSAISFIYKQPKVMKLESFATPRPAARSKTRFSTYCSLELVLGIHCIAMQRYLGFGDAKAAYKTYRTIKKLQPDILHGHGAKGGVYARLFGSVLRVF